MTQPYRDQTQEAAKPVPKVGWCVYACATPFLINGDREWFGWGPFRWKWQASLVAAIERWSMDYSGVAVVEYGERNTKAYVEKHWMGAR